MSGQDDNKGQRQYRHGVLIFNSNEDRIGSILAHTKPKKPEFTTTSQAFHGKQSTVAQSDNLPAQYTFNRRGQPAHLIFGHGLNEDELNRREFSTAYDMSFKHKFKAHETVDSHFKAPDAQPIRERAVNDDRKEVHKPKAYYEMTRRCDDNMNRTGLRK